MVYVLPQLTLVPSTQANACPPEILSMIFDFLVGPGDSANVEPARSWLQACALVRSNWTGPAQRILHRTVTITSGNYTSRLKAYRTPHIRYFPQELRVSQWTSLECSTWLRSEPIRTFAASCGTHIRRLRIRELSFGNFKRFSDFVGLFPSLEDLDLSRWVICNWTSGHCKRFRSNPLSLDGCCPPPKSLRTVRLSHECGLELGDMLAVAEWLKHPSLENHRPDVELEIFQQGQEHDHSLCAAIEAFGSRLTKLTLPIEPGYGTDIIRKLQQYLSDVELLLTYSFSELTHPCNTRLKSLHMCTVGWNSPHPVAEKLATFRNSPLQTVSLNLVLAPSTSAYMDIETQLDGILTQLSSMNELRVAAICILDSTVTPHLGCRTRRGPLSGVIARKLASMRKKGINVEVMVKAMLDCHRW
ncbi:hypothetical protein BC629DRAFT_1166479 [Irpex lacteus]|nr:hypothetical protein BC629DRAFT_1166479 [Irpex lacteus]